MGPEHIEGFENMLNSNVDLSNPKFRGYPQAEVARKLKSLYDNHIWGERLRAALTQCGNYVNHVQKIMETIVKKGYKILPEQGACQDKKKAEKALQRELADYQNSRQLKEGQVKEEIPFPTVTVNGKQYCTYGYNGMAKILEEHTLQFKNKDNVKKAGEQFDDITMLCFRYLGESFEK
ncbi:MAG: hypothetical protein IJJ13_10375 [Lachnospiraceae bacterium]|nr:hypothetical protein [Lachnospiraceae bacterium]